MSEQPPRPLFRTSRAIVFATVCVTLATLAHALASPMPVPSWAVLAGFGGVLAVTLALAGHERSLPTLTGGLLGGQFALHTLFASAEAPAMAQHHPEAMPAASVMPGGHGSGATMTLAHIAAAVLSAWWLRRGERAAWALARRLSVMAERPVRLLLALTAVEPAAPPMRTPVVPAADVPGPTDRVLRHLVVRRGPPSRSRALAHL